MDLQTKYKTLRICLTSNCNIRCFYCCSEGHRGEFSIFNQENACKLIASAYDILKITRVKYTGGEPLLFGDLFSTIEQINHDYPNRIQQTIVTNGVLFNLLEQLVKKFPFLGITLSIPSLNSGIFKKVVQRGEDQFENIMKSLNLLCNNGKPFKINYVIIKGVNDSREHLEDILTLAYKNHNCNLRFLAPIKNNVNNLNEKYLINSSDFIETLQNQFGFKVTSDKRSHIFLKNGNINIKYILSFCASSCNNCPEDKTSLWVTPEGKLRTCCYGNMKEKEHLISDWKLKTVNRQLRKYK